MEPRSKESFERVPFITAALTHLGFYILMILGFINHLFFTPKVAKEYNREVSPLLRNGKEECHGHSKINLRVLISMRTYLHHRFFFNELVDHWIRLNNGCCAWDKVDLELSSVASSAFFNASRLDCNVPTLYTTRKML